VSFGVPNGAPSPDALLPCKRCGKRPEYSALGDGLYECPDADVHAMADFNAAEIAKRARAAARWNNDNRKGK
jgi:hypothetical protein